MRFLRRLVSSSPQPKQDTSSAEFFEEKYRKSADPWNFAKSTYEQSRYDVIMAALAGRRYRSAFEPGCSVGALTCRLATICDSVEAIDFSSSAIATARSRCALPGVTFGVTGLPERMPLIGFDLVVLSEIGYYFSAEEWAALVNGMAASAAPGTTFLAAHWLGVSPDHRMHGDEVHAILRDAEKLHLMHEERHAGFRLDRLERTE